MVNCSALSHPDSCVAFTECRWNWSKYRCDTSYSWIYGVVIALIFVILISCLIYWCCCRSVPEEKPPATATVVTVSSPRPAANTYPYPPHYPYPPQYAYPPPQHACPPQYPYPQAYPRADGVVDENGKIQMTEAQIRAMLETEREDAERQMAIHAATAAELAEKQRIEAPSTASSPPNSPRLARPEEATPGSPDGVRLVIQNETSEEKRRLKENLEAEQRRVAELAARVQWLNETLRRREAELLDKDKERNEQTKQQGATPTAAAAEQPAASP